MTIQTLRPNGQYIISGTVNTSAALPTYTVTSDSSDATFMTGASNKAYVGLAMGDMTPLTAGQRIKSLTMRARSCLNVSTGHVETCLLKMLRYPVNTTAPEGDWTLTRADTTPKTYAGPIAFTGFDSADWTEAGVNALRVNVQWINAPVAEWLRVHEIYVDVDVNNQPVVSGAPVVTNFTNNSRPTVTWNYTDIDGDPQTYFQVKIFDAATYGTGNFNPDTSLAAFDSGEISSDETSYTLTGDLLNGITYKAYVKAGQTWKTTTGTGSTSGLNQSHLMFVATQVWWSAWAVSASFTVVLTPPYTPTLTAVENLDDQQASALINIITPMNLLYYDASSFESGVGGWTADTNVAAPTTSTTDAADGTHSLIMSSSAGGDMRVKSGFDFLGDPRVGPGKTYTALCSFHAATVGRSCAVGIRWIDITGAAIGADVFGSNVTDVTTAGVYTQAFVTATSPGNATQALVIAKVISTGGAAEVHRIDKASIHSGSSTVWTLGGMAPQPTQLFVERGERLDTRRGPAENWLHPQVASAGTDYHNHGYGFKWVSGQDLVNWEWLDKVITTPGLTPSGMLRWQPRTAAVNKLTFATWLYWPETDFNCPVVVGQVHIASFWAWCRTGTFTTTPKIEWLNDDTSVNTTTTGSQVTLTTTPQRVTVTGTCPANASAARFLMTNDASAITNDVFVTRLGFGLGTVPVDGKPARGGPLMWSQVRMTQAAANWAFPVGFGAGETVNYHDFECPPARPVLYRVRNGWTFGGNTLTSPNSPYATLMMSLPTRTLLRSVTDTSLAAFVNRRRQATFSRVEDAQTYHPLGRDGGPVRIRDWMGGEDGELVLITSNETQMARLNDLVESSSVLQLQWAQGGRSYILITDRSYSEDLVDYAFCDVDGTEPQLRYAVHTLTYVETQAP